LTVRAVVATLELENVRRAADDPFMGAVGTVAITVREGSAGVPWAFE
jgi:hypothetical protein